jgi:hypothetical protein
MKVDQNPLTKYPNEGTAQWDPIVESVMDKPPRRVDPYAADCTAKISAKGRTWRVGNYRPERHRHKTHIITD